MPNRFINEKICTGRSINSLTDFQFRLWTALLLSANDYGEGDARPQIIKGHCFPLRQQATPKKIAKAMTEMVEKGVITISSRENLPVFKIVGWEKFQQDAGRRTPDYKIWRNSVFERDNYTCQMCGKVGGKLNAHHKRRYRNDINARTDIDNGITLCEQCHREVHRKEGR